MGTETHTEKGHLHPRPIYLHLHPRIARRTNQRTAEREGSMRACVKGASVMHTLAVIALVACVVACVTPSVEARYTIELKRSVNAQQRNTVLMQLKELQSQNAALVETGDEPLSVETLSSKHLATYYGEIS